MHDEPSRPAEPDGEKRESDFVPAAELVKKELDRIKAAAAR